jgi:signal transduction histidine kinase
MRTIIFIAMVSVALVPLAYKLQTNQATAFKRELEIVEQGHLIIARNLASTLARYAADTQNTFDFLIANRDENWQGNSLRALLDTFCLRYIGVLGPDNSVAQTVFGSTDVLPDGQLIDDLRQLANHDQTTLSGVTRVGDEPFIFLVRLGDNGQLYVGAFDLLFLVKQQAAISFGDRGHAMIVDQNGTVIAHPNPDWTRQSVDASKLPVVQRMMAGQTGVMQFFSPPLSADMIAGFTSVKETGWGVMVPQPLAELEDAAKTEASALLRTFIVLACATAAMGWFLSGFIVRPLTKVSTTVDKVREGDLSARVPTLTQPVPVEIASLRSILNDLLDRVTKNRVMLEDALKVARKSNQEISQAMSVLSHEMRTPLNGIIGATELIKEDRENRSHDTYIDIIQVSAQTLLGHVNDVLEAGKLGAAATDNVYSTVQIADWLQNIVDEATPVATQNGSRIILQLDVKLPRELTVDERKLRNIMTNLVGNAAKFTQNGKITVGIQMHPKGWMEIKVQDTGPGIPDIDQERIFQPFVVLDSSYQRKQIGSGLGLSIVSLAVEALGGILSIDSTHGVGSEFCVRIPIDTASSASRTPPVSTPPPIGETEKTTQETLAKMSILVVDDNTINRAVMASMVEKIGSDVTLASDGNSAVKLANEKKFDIIFMDISMPEMDGLEATRRIRQSSGPNQNTVVVAQTAHVSPPDHARFMNATLQDMLLKPVTLAALTACLRRWSH